MSKNNANNAVVAIYNTHAEAEAAVKELQRSRCEMEKVSIVRRDYQPSLTSPQACAVGT